MDYRLSYSGDRVWKHTKGVELKHLRDDLVGDGRRDMVGLSQARRENGYLLEPGRMSQIRFRFKKIEYLYDYSPLGL